MNGNGKTFPSLSVAWFILLAVLLHAGLWLYDRAHPIWDLSAKTTAEGEKEKDDTITVEPFKEGTPDKPIVQTSRPKKQSEKNKDKVARFNGEQRQRVEKETQSPVRGKFQQGFAGRGAPDGDGNDVVAEDDKNGVPADGERKRGRGPKGLTMSDLMAFGSSPHALPKDIGEGNETVLNTDHVRYASFINRIADEIYDPWVQFAREAVDSIYLQGRKLEENTYVTKLSVVMNSKGEVDAIQTLQSSGIDVLDEAPKKAFWEVEPFTNPPSQMFKKDDVIRFVYEFHFEWKTSSFNIVPFKI